MKFFLSLAATAFLFISTVSAEITLPKIFGDGMVLQRDMPVPVWGWAGKGEKVSVSFAGQVKTAEAGDDGKWMAIFDPLKVSSEPRIMTVSSSKTAQSPNLQIKNILVGEVWLCSGQSNMEAGVKNALNAKEEIASAQFPNLRQFKAVHNSSSQPLDDIEGKWSVCSPETAGEFTAAGYFFAREIMKELDVPVGLLGCAWGGTRIEPWISPAGYHGEPELAKFADMVDEWNSTTDKGRLKYAEWIAKVKEWMPQAEAAINSGKRFKLPPQSPAPYRDDFLSPCQTFNAMIYPVIPYSIRGVLWYQGEAVTQQYYIKLKALISGWRKSWKQTGDFSFYIVQLPNFKSGFWMTVREDQLKASLTVPNTGLAVTIDVGDPNDLHPKNKQDVGHRLALQALAKTYGKKISCDGPVYKTHKVEGGKVALTFDNAQSGLICGEKKSLEPVKEIPGGSFKCFQIAGEDKKWHSASAVIDGNRVIVSSSEVPSPVAVRYAFTDNPEGCLLYNKDGLPASPFRTDNW